NTNHKYANVLSAISDIQNSQADYGKSLSNKKKVAEAYKEANDFLRYGITVGKIGATYMNLGDYKKSFEQSVAALKILDTIEQEPWRKADLKLQIGNIEYKRQNYLESLRYYNQALDLYRDMEDNIWEAYTLNDIANSYFDLDSLDQAETYYKKALSIAENYELLDIQAFVWSNLGAIYTKKGELKIAREEINRALVFNKNQYDINNILSNYIAFIELELKSKNRRAALNYANKGLALADSIKSMDSKSKFILFRSEIYGERGNYRRAYEDLNRYVVLNDSLTKVNNSKQIDELKIIYETEQKEKELIIQQNEIKLLKERQQRAEIQKWFIIITLLGIMAFTIAVIYGLRQKMKRNRLIREQLDKSLGFKEKELTTHALHLAHKNEILLDLKKQLKELKTKGTNTYQYQKIINNINLDINNDNNWQQFRSYFEEVHKDFNSKILKTYPEVSNNDLRLMSLLKMNLSSKEIANILNISIEGVKKARYRLRKKLNLSTEESLQELVIEL
ncbi:MAG: tetratricopeptide repeat protein, partial [Bacteroidota bacterium]